jgi:hypothetical protein
MKVKNGKEVLDCEGIFIELDNEGNGIFISEDEGMDFGNYECVGDTGEIEVNGKVIKWGVLFG